MVKSVTRGRSSAVGAFRRVVTYTRAPPPAGRLLAPAPAVAAAVAAGAVVVVRITHRRLGRQERAADPVELGAEAAGELAVGHHGGDEVPENRVLHRGPAVDLVEHRHAEAHRDPRR